jgi:hypothetical protein
MRGPSTLLILPVPPPSISGSRPSAEIEAEQATLLMGRFKRLGAVASLAGPPRLPRKSCHEAEINPQPQGRLDWSGWQAIRNRLFPLLRHRHHVGVEIGDDPDRTGDDEKDDQHAKGESQNIIRAVGPAAQMQKEDEMDADLR